MAMTKTEFEQRLVDALEALGDIGPYTETYKFAANDFGAGDATQIIQGPSGRTGKVVALSVYNVTEVFNEVTTPARIDVGTVADPDGYSVGGTLASLGVGEATAQEAAAGALGNSFPGAEDVQISLIAPTGGTPTGIADAAVIIRWT